MAIPMAQKYHLIKCLIDKCAMLHEPYKFTRIQCRTRGEDARSWCTQNRSSLVESLIDFLPQTCSSSARSVRSIITFIEVQAKQKGPRTQNAMMINFIKAQSALVLPSQAPNWNENASRDPENIEDIDLNRHRKSGPRDSEPIIYLSHGLILVFFVYPSRNECDLLQITRKKSIITHFVSYRQWGTMCKGLSPRRSHYLKCGALFRPLSFFPGRNVFNWMLCTQKRASLWVINKKARPRKHSIESWNNKNTLSMQWNQNLLFKKCALHVFIVINNFPTAELYRSRATTRRVRG